jgi:hypothetical protein
MFAAVVVLVLPQLLNAIGLHTYANPSLTAVSFSKATYHLLPITTISHDWQLWTKRPDLRCQVYMKRQGTGSTPTYFNESMPGVFILKNYYNFMSDNSLWVACDGVVQSYDFYIKPLTDATNTLNFYRSSGLYLSDYVNPQPGYAKVVFSTAANCSVTSYTSGAKKVVAGVPGTKFTYTFTNVRLDQDIYFIDSCNLGGTVTLTATITKTGSTPTRLRRHL